MRLQVIILICLVGFVYSEFYSSVAQLKQSLRYVNRLNVTKSLQTYIETKEKQLIYIEKIVESLKGLSEEVMDPAFDLEHPLNAYRFIRNQSLVYNQTVTHLFSAIDTFQKEPLDMSTFERVIKSLPSQTDLEAIVDGIFRLQEVYDIPAEEFVFGRLYSGLSDTITALQCHYIAERALTTKRFFFARDWINLAIFLVSMKNDTTAPLHLLLEDASVIAFSAGNTIEAMRITRHIVEIKPTDRTARKLYKEYQKIHDSKSDEEKENMAKIGTESPSRTPKETHQDMLCRGQVEHLKKTTRQKKEKLYCWYQDNKHPLLMFRPGQLEQVSTHPYIVLYHDFLSKDEIQILKSYAAPRLKRSTLLESKELSYTSNDYRISKTAIIFEHTMKDMIQNRIEALTVSSGFDGFEAFQVTNYGIGGQYKTHADFFPERMVNSQKAFQRQSTFMVYLSDVQAGGATIFPRINEAIFPEAGKAVFWYNTFRNGSGNPLTVHAACPVLVGDKWICNQWILMEGQELLRPCTLNKLE